MKEGMYYQVTYSVLIFLSLSWPANKYGNRIVLTFSTHFF
jgi:hypothetical protein